jgi:polyhydroxybutyrate depolymerase
MVSMTCCLVGALCVMLLAPACRGDGPQTGSETNFLTSCDAGCPEGLACICGVCTRACSSDDDCASLASGTECTAVAARGSEAACPKGETDEFCDLPCGEDADCAVLDSRFQCRAGYCREPGDAGAAIACPATTLTVGDNERTIAVGDVTRSYIVHLPANYTGTDPVPLILDFHALGATAQDAAAASGYRELSEQEGFIVALPQGIDDAWNIGPCCTQSRDVDDVGFARALVQELQTVACVDPKRVYAAGLVMGGGMAYHLACNAADVFAGIAPSAFDLLVESEQPCQPVRPVTVISFRGTADAVVPYEGGAQQPPNGLDVTITLLGAVGTFERWAELDQCAGDPSAPDSDGCSSYSDCADGAEVVLCTTEGGGTDLGSADIGWGVLKRHSMP